MPDSTGTLLHEGGRSKCSCHCDPLQQTLESLEELWMPADAAAIGQDVVRTTGDEGLCTAGSNGKISLGLNPFVEESSSIFLRLLGRLLPQLVAHPGKLELPLFNE